MPDETSAAVKSEGGETGRKADYFQKKEAVE